MKITNIEQNKQNYIKSKIKSELNFLSTARYLVTAGCSDNFPTTFSATRKFNSLDKHFSSVLILLTFPQHVMYSAVNTADNWKVFNYPYNVKGK